MADNDGNSWFREALAAKRRRQYGIAEEPETEPEKPKPLDLGQGARGPIPKPPPTMGDVIRGALAAKRSHVHDEIELEQEIRTTRERFG